MNPSPTSLPASSTRGGPFADDLRALVSGDTRFSIDEPLARRTTFRVGGPADIFIEPASESDLAAIVRRCQALARPFFVLGRGSNLLVKDRGYRGVVICLSQTPFSRIEVVGQRLRCGAGAKLKAVAVEAKRHELAGLEFLEGIPGSVGGALRMNAGAMGAATFDVVESIRLMDFTGRARDWPAAEVAVAYRQSTTLKTHIAISALLRGQASTRAQIEERMLRFSQRRWQAQPAAPSAGCTFKNPAAIPAGLLIDQLGLKGTRVGGASVSMEHGNFIVNDGSATAQDILQLIELIRRRAREKSGIELDLEVEIIGE